ncbi:MAG: YitT family protein [Clostridia bacterium]|nr:YitT family protein [Clostridia bacterium]
MTKKKHVFLKVLSKYFFLFIGSVLAAAGLEFFLIPNNIIDGGIVGISIILSYLAKIPLGIFTFALNIPFLIFGYKQIGKTFVLSSLFSVTCFSFWVSVFHPIPGLTNDILLATVFGGIVLGVGVGLIIRYGGSLDGTEIVAIVLNKRTSFSVGQIVMFFNIFIISSAGLVFGWDKAMYSLIAYFITFKVIDITIEGLDEAKAAIIISEKGDEIAEAINARLGRGVTFLEGKGGYTKKGKTILYSVITRLEVAKLKGIINDKDENAFVTISDVFDIMGGKHKKKNIH